MSVGVGLHRTRLNGCRRVDLVHPGKADPGLGGGSYASPPDGQAFRGKQISGWADRRNAEPRISRAKRKAPEGAFL